MTMEEIYFIEIYTALIELKGGATEKYVGSFGFASNKHMISWYQGILSK